MRIFLKTHQGLVRSSNQDAGDYAIISDDCAWSVVCDGMGGANGGNIASTLAVETVVEMLNEKFKPGLMPEQLYGLSLQCVESANTAVYAKAMYEDGLKGMGTTMVLILIDDGQLHISHVGDSRAYLCRAGKVTQLTQDHSFVQDLVNRGEISQDQARVHPHRNIITRSVGVYSMVSTDYNVHALEKGDIIISCSDGLTNYLEDTVFEDIIANNNIENLCEVLTNFALENGGSDNITVSVTEI